MCKNICQVLIAIAVVLPSLGVAAQHDAASAWLDAIAVDLDSEGGERGREAANLVDAAVLAEAFDEASPAGRRALVAHAVLTARLAGARREDLARGLEIVERAIRTAPVIQGCRWSEEDYDYVGCDGIEELDRVQQIVVRRRAHGVPASELLALVAHVRRSL